MKNSTLEVCYGNACVKGSGKYADFLLATLAIVLVVRITKYLVSK